MRCQIQRRVASCTRPLPGRGSWQPRYMPSTADRTRGPSAPSRRSKNIDTRPGPPTYFLMANTVRPTVTFRSRNCSFRMSMSKVPSQTMGASHGVSTRTSFLLPESHSHA